MARWDDETFTNGMPVLADVICKDCVHREKDRYYNGDVAVRGAILSMCEEYSLKPSGILFDKEKCERYKKE